MLARWWACMCVAVGIIGAVRVGLLSEHSSEAWDDACKDTPRSVVDCNLRLYSRAIALAGDNDVDLMVFPEGYALQPAHFGKFWYEPHPLELNGTAPDPHLHPQLWTLSVSAKEHQVSVAANMFTVLQNGTHRITEVVLGPDGGLVAVYDKHHLFPPERLFFSPGPFHPTTFTVAGRRMGILICYEGVYPELTHNYAQMESLVAQNATAFVWSIGGMVSISWQGKPLAERFKVALAAVEDQARGQLVKPDGSNVATKSLSIRAVDGYQGEAVVDFGVLP